MMFTRPANSRREPSRRGVVQHDEGWFYQGQAAHRLWNKSAIGRLVGSEGLLLSSSEVVFCHEHRHLEWPFDSWLSEQLGERPRLLEEAAILEALRVPGNRIVLHSNFEAMGLSSAAASWGLRWPSEEHPSTSEATYEVRWYHASEELDIEDLFEWSEQVREGGRMAEVLVVDDEHAVVTYRVGAVEPEGEMGDVPDDDFVTISELGMSSGLDNGGSFIHFEGDWPNDRVGIPYPSGRIMDQQASELVEAMANGSAGSLSIGASILGDLLNRGLHPRPGFKYGTRWRCYDRPMGEDHAPWLVVHPAEGPVDWEGACLASRLASGVNKTWLHPLLVESEWRYLSITRPPADSRWNNPHRR